MAVMVFNDAKFTFNDVVLSDHVKSLKINYEGPTVELTAMGGSAAIHLGTGITNWTVDVEFFQDYGASEVYVTLFGLMGGDSGAADTIQIQADATTAVSATNPRFHGDAILTSMGVVDGALGEPMMCTCTFQGSDTLTAASS